MNTFFEKPYIYKNDLDKYMERLINEVAKRIWGPELVGLLVGIGFYYMLATRLAPIKKLFPTLKRVLTGKVNDSSAKALYTSLGAAMGTGNIVGVATALVLGGPGAMFWMMVSGVLGLATCMIECAICSKYKLNKGLCYGGPMHVLTERVNNKSVGKLLGFTYAFLVVFAGIGMGNMTQANSMANALNKGSGISVKLVGIGIAIIILIISLKGCEIIFKINSFLVPLMSVIYLFFCTIIIVINYHKVPMCLNSFFTAAISKKAFVGALFGDVVYSRKNAVRFGMARGVMSNEAGLGTAGICAAHSTNDNYIEQGYISMCSVFIDTIVVCMLSGLALATSGCVGMKKEGIYLIGVDLCREVFGKSFGKYGEIILTICVVLFALATIISWIYQGKEAYNFIFKGKKEEIFIVIFAFAAFLGAIYPIELVWNMADICNGLLVIPNVVCLSLFGKNIVKEINDYNRFNK